MIPAATPFGPCGITTPDTFYPERSSLELPQSNRPLQNFGGGSCGGTLFEAFTRSCNVVFAQLGLELGNDFVPRMADCGVAAGDGPPLDPEPGAEPSIGPPAGSFDDDKPSFARAGIGQDPVRVTPLEMAMVAAGIGNGGVMMVPHVAQQITDSDGNVLRDIAPEVWKTCTSPYKVATKNLKASKDGSKHVVRVRAVLAGVVDATPSKKTFKVLKS